MKNAVHYINLTEESNLQLSLEVRSDNENTNIIINEKGSTIELAKEIKKRFHSIDSNTRSFVLDLSKIESMKSNIYLTILNIVILSKTHGIDFNVIVDMEKMRCTGCYSLVDSKDFNCDLYIAKLVDVINKY